MVVSNDVFNDQFQASCGGINPASEPVLEIRIRARFVNEQTHPVKPMGTVGNDERDLVRSRRARPSDRLEIATQALQGSQTTK